jgi:hypothetical protein
MDSDISEEELTIFLKEAGIFTKPPQTTQQMQKKEDSLEELIEEIIGSVQTAPSSPASLAEKQILPSLFDGGKPKGSRFPLLPLFLSITFLGGTFLGIIFGFYWGQTQRVETPVASFEEMDATLKLLVNQIQEIYDKVTPVTPPGEIIEPLEPPHETEKLS